MDRWYLGYHKDAKYNSQTNLKGSFFLMYLYERKTGKKSKSFNSNSIDGFSHTAKKTTYFMNTTDSMKKNCQNFFFIISIEAYTILLILLVLFLTIVAEILFVTR